MKRLIGIAFVLCLLGSPAFATCPGTLQLKDNVGVTANGKYVDDGSGNCQPSVVLAPNTGEVGTPATSVSQPTGGVGLSGWLSGIYKALTGTITVTGTVQPGNTANTTPWLVNVNNTNANGAATPANSSPVTPSNQPVGAANFAPAQVSVGSTATLIAAARTGVSGTGRVSITITNTTTTAIYLGGSGVTTGTGQYLAGVVGASATFNTTAAIYGIVATGSAAVAESETY